jgi:hypothetical protein
MGDDLKASIEALTKTMELMQKSIEANAKAIHDLSTGSSASGGRPGPGEHHQDRPPKHWRPEFPHYDGKSDPLIQLEGELGLQGRGRCHGQPAGCHRMSCGATHQALVGV